MNRPARHLSVTLITLATGFGCATTLDVDDANQQADVDDGGASTEAEPEGEPEVVAEPDGSTEPEGSGPLAPVSEAPAAGDPPDAGAPAEPELPPNAIPTGTAPVVPPPPEEPEPVGAPEPTDGDAGTPVVPPEPEPAPIVDAGPSPHSCSGEPILVSASWTAPVETIECETGTCRTGTADGAIASDGTLWTVSGVGTEGGDSNVGGISVQRYAADGTRLSSELVRFEVLDREASITFLPAISVGTEGDAWLSLHRAMNPPDGSPQVNSTEVLHFAADGSPVGDPVELGTSHVVTQRVTSNDELVLALANGISSVSADGQVTPLVSFEGTTYITKGTFNPSGQFSGFELRQAQVASEDTFARLSYGADGQLLWEEIIDFAGQAWLHALQLNDGTSIDLQYPPSQFDLTVHDRNPWISLVRRDAEGTIVETSAVAPYTGDYGSSQAPSVEDAAGNLYVSGETTIDDVKRATIFRLDGAGGCDTFVVTDLEFPVIWQMRMGADGDLLVTPGEGLYRISLP